MKKIVKLTEKDLQRIVKRVIKESRLNELGGMDDGHPRFGDLNFSKLSNDDIIRMGQEDDYYPSYDTSGEFKGMTELNGDMDIEDIEETIDDISDDDEYYGTFDGDYRVDRRNTTNFDDYDEFEEEEFEDFDSYRKSRYGSDRKNKWEFNSPDEEMGRKYFKTYQEKSGGKPFRVRRRNQR